MSGPAAVKCNSRTVQHQVARTDRREMMGYTSFCLTP
jgi:hypothetical protein